MLKCLKCEKELKIQENCSNIDDAGYVEVSFHYGSRHDQCLGFRPRSRKRHLEFGTDRLHRLLASDKIQSYICDDCFEKHVDLFEGYDIDTKTEETKVV